MKSSDKKKPVKTIHEGVWEASRPQKKKTKTSPTTDLQGNGYPTNKTTK